MRELKKPICPLSVPADKQNMNLKQNCIEMRNHNHMYMHIQIITYSKYTPIHTSRSWIRERCAF